VCRSVKTNPNFGKMNEKPTSSKDLLKMSGDKKENGFWGSVYPGWKVCGGFQADFSCSVFIVFQKQFVNKIHLQQQGLLE
jgi:hypothetical protein